MMYLGVDIGGTAVKLGIVTEAGDILAFSAYDVAFDHYETPIIDTVKLAIKDFIQKASISLSDLKGIGVSATGQIDVYKGSVVGVGGNIKNWLDTNIKQVLEAEFNLPTTVLNDANSMILGEVWLGRANFVDHVIGITIGTGVGGGIIVNGQILNGAIGIGGEVGHFSIHKEGVVCGCGNVGCYERYASMTALVRTVKAHYDELELSETVDAINGKLIFDYVRQGHVLMTKLVQGWIENIGAGLVSLIHLFNPQLIVIGGGVSTQEALFIQPLSDYVLEHAMPKFKENLTIVGAKLGNEAGLVGAVYHHIKSK